MALHRFRRSPSAICGRVIDMASPCRNSCPGGRAAASAGDVNSGPLPSAFAGRCLAPSAHKIAKMATFLSRFRGGTAFAR
jgi:hypothetical protein